MRSKTRLQNEKGSSPKRRARRTTREYGALQRQLAALFRETADDPQRITVMLEMMRILENRLVYLQNFIVDPTSDNRDARATGHAVHRRARRARAAGAHEARGDVLPRRGRALRRRRRRAREGFRDACASEESDEANDIKYKSYVILGNLSHEERDYAKAKDCTISRSATRRTTTSRRRRWRSRR